jgi:hypothetical protein
MSNPITALQRLGIGLRAIVWFHKQNPAWKIESIKWTRTLATPEHLTGTL